MGAFRFPLLSLVVLDFCLLRTSHAEPSVTLSGTVKDAKTGEPLPGALGFDAGVRLRGVLGVRARL